MTIDTVRAQVVDISNTVFENAEKISKIAIDNLGFAYEWLVNNLPFAMQQSYIIAQKVIVATSEGFITAGTWAIENKDFLATSSIGIIIGLSIAAIVFARMHPKKP